MKVIICGAGRVGLGIAQHLSLEGDDVTVIDNSQELIQHINDVLDVRALVGHAAHPDVLEEAEAKDTDVFIAVAASDEINMIACQIAYSIFSIPKRIARIRDQKYFKKKWNHLFSQENIPVDVIISPEQEVAETVLRRLEIPRAYDSRRFGENKIQFLALYLEEKCPVLDTPLQQLTELFPHLQAVIVGIKRDNKIFIPKKNDTMIVGDRAFIITQSKDTERIMNIFGLEQEEARNIILIGGGNVSRYVASKLEEKSHLNSIKIIEHIEATAHKAREALKRGVVFHGSALNPEILREAGVRNTEMVVALTNNDQVNILSILLAREEGCMRSLCLINDRHFFDLSQSIGLGISIDPQATTISSVLAHIRQGNILTVHSISSGEAEVIETKLLDNFPIIGQKIRSLDMSDKIKIGAIIRDNNFLIPSANMELNVGDRVVFFVLAEAIKQLELLLSREQNLT